MQNELEEYLQLASHELKAPLRKIRVFGELLKEESMPVLSKESIGYLDRLMKNVYRMQSLLEDLTIFTNFTIGNTTESCDLNQVLQKAITGLALAEYGKSPPIRVEQLPVARGNTTALEEVFKSLLSNSFKFRSPERTLAIEVLAGEVDQTDKDTYGLSFHTPYCKIRFVDNGIGFDEEDRERIFKPFIQLNGKSAFPGNGLGLALCKKIIDAHNGIIYASGNHSGSCITLILPLSGQ